MTVEVDAVQLTKDNIFDVAAMFEENVISDGKLRFKDTWSEGEYFLEAAIGQYIVKKPDGHYFVQNEQNFQEELRMHRFKQWSLEIEKIEEIHYIERVHNMCIESLSPDAFGKWEDVLKSLKLVRRAFKEGGE
jgi:hypothetical protein